MARYGDFVASGRAGIERYFAAREAQAERMSRHVCNNSLIDVIDENNATGVTYLTLYRHDGEPGRASSPTQAPEMVGEYRDTFARTAGRLEIRDARPRGVLRSYSW